ncbi:MAG: protein-L-isoaspartate(D-aspartate) O-methyltransferase, partial [candidate division KSB1 bacterium]|nr:protein-L-isoaspartate(D-aspartate) O-methyltransferase [candidate division KSB1 bacterium]
MKDRQPSMEELQKQREKMVQFQIKARGVSDPKVLQAMLRVPRHEFVPATYRDDAYEDFPLPIGYGQTISQPYIVAYMTEALHLKGGEKVLEIGTGSGYQAAVLAEIAGQVYSIEIVEPLCREAAQRLQQLGYANVSVRCGDGYAGWPEAAPFDAIILTAAPEEIPQPLVEQLGEGGRMILPLGRFSQNLVLLTKQEGKVNKRNLLPVR